MAQLSICSDRLSVRLRFGRRVTEIIGSVLAGA